MKTLTDRETSTVDTWLPIFSGFYGTIWETDSDEEMEIENINEERKQKGFAPIEYDAVEWGYKEYQKNVAEGVAREVVAELKNLGLIASGTFQELKSPREYNFYNDSINVQFAFTKANIRNIAAYLKKHEDKFSEYLLDRYTSRSGFMSFHSNALDAWVGDVLGETMSDGHKAGSVLNFILLNEDSDMEVHIYENLHGNGCFLAASNYQKLTEVA